MQGRRISGWLLALGLSASAGGAFAQGHRDMPPMPPGRNIPGAHPIPGAHVVPAGQLPPGHLAAQGEHSAGGHAAAHEHDESGPPEPINWFHGLLGEKADVPPSLLWRAPGEPPPFLATAINFGLLVLIAVYYGKKPLAAALSKRKETILREIDEARRLREEAEKRLSEYEAKLAKIGEELERIRSDFREQGERDKQRIVSEAKERRERMKRDADFLLAQEIKQMRHDLIVETVEEATRQAADLMAKRLTEADHSRFAEAFLAQLRSDSERGGGSGSSYQAVAKGGAS